MRSITTRGNPWLPSYIIMGLAFVSLQAAESRAQSEILIAGKPAASLLKNLQSKNRGKQVRAGRALGEADAKDHAKLVPMLIPLLASDRKNTRAFIAQALGRFGNVSRPAVAALLPLLEGTQYERNRTEASRALGKILKDAKDSEEVKKVVAALIKGFKDKYSDVRRESVQACGMIGPAAKDCLDHITPLLREHKLGVAKYEGYQVRLAAAWTVTRMGKHSVKLVDLMISLMHADANVNKHTVTALGVIGPVNPNVAANLIDKVESTGRPWDYMSFKLEAYKALLSFGPKAKPAVGVMARYLKSECRQPPAGVILILKTIKAVGLHAAKEDQESALVNMKRFLTIKSYKGDREAATPDQIAEMQKEAKEAIAVLSSK